MFLNDRQDDPLPKYGEEIMYWWGRIQHLLYCLQWINWYEKFHIKWIKLTAITVLFDNDECYNEPCYIVEGTWISSSVYHKSLLSGGSHLFSTIMVSSGYQNPEDNSKSCYDHRHKNIWTDDIWDIPCTL